MARLFRPENVRFRDRNGGFVFIYGEIDEQDRAGGAYTMTKAETAALSTMTPEQLIEGFVRETKLYQLSGVQRANKAADDLAAIADEISRRGGLPSLAPLMDGPDPFIAYSAARLLARLEDFRERALAVLDRIADGHLGSASTRARIARNVIRYGNPDGDPVEYERELAEVRARYKRA